MDKEPTGFCETCQYKPSCLHWCKQKANLFRMLLVEQITSEARRKQEDEQSNLPEQEM